MKLANIRPELLLSLVLFGVSLCCDGYYIDGPDPRAWAPAYALLMFGWIGLFAGTMAWLANPLLIGAWVCCLRGKWNGALTCSIIAAFFAATFLTQERVLISERPDYADITSYRLGYWLWLASAVVLALGTGYRIRLRASSR